MSDEVAGQVTSRSSNSIIRSGESTLMRIAHCECGERAMPVMSEGNLIGYRCWEHGLLTHDAILYVYHDIKDQR
jgi:hypothetical protein